MADMDVGEERPRRPPQPYFDSVRVEAALNGWIITRPIGTPIVIQKITGEDNVAKLLAQLSVLFEGLEAEEGR